MGHQRISKTLSLGSLCCSQTAESQFARFGIHSPHVICWTLQSSGALPCSTEPGSHSIGDSLLQRGRCLRKRAKTTSVGSSCQDLHFCCMQQEAGHILCVGEVTLCRQIPYEVKISPRWAKSLYIYPAYRRKNPNHAVTRIFFPTQRSTALLLRGWCSSQVLQVHETRNEGGISLYWESAHFCREEGTESLISKTFKPLAATGFHATGIPVKIACVEEGRMEMDLGNWTGSSLFSVFRGEYSSL